MARTLRAILIVTVWLGGAARCEDGPTAAHDAARTGRTGDTSSPPWKLVWAKSWRYENIATVSQLIVAGGRGFIGTLGRDGALGGKIHAVDLKDGRDLWTYDRLQGGVAHTLTWHPHEGGTVYAATTFGEVVALAADTGRLRWRFQADGGFVVNPCVADDSVLLGGRDGRFYALRLDTGRPRWQRKVGVPICTTAAAADGVVYIMDESIRAHAMRIADGRDVAGWPTKRLPGGSARHYWPVVAGECVIFRVAPPHQYNWHQTEAVLFANVPGVSTRNQADLMAMGTPQQERTEQREVIAWLKESPHNQVMHCLRRRDGQPACTPGVFYTGGSGSVGNPPVVTAEGQVLVEYRTYWSVYDNNSWVNQFSAVGVLDLKTGVVRQIKPYGGRRKTLPWGHIWVIPDESSTFTIGGGRLFISHQGNFGVIELPGGRTSAGVGKRDTWGGFAALSWCRQEWHGAPRSPVTVCDNVVYYVVGGRILACKGAER